MARKKKPKPFRAVTAVKLAAREQIGTPPPTKRIESEKRKNRAKHKLTRADLLTDEE